jgi:hypothetical protein
MLPPQSRLDLHLSEVLRNVEWYFSTDVSGQAIGPRGNPFFLEFLTHKDETYRLSRNVSTALPLNAA